MNNTQPNNIYPIFDRMLGREDKEALLKQRSVMVWFIGLSGSGKVRLPLLWSVSCISAVCYAVFWMATISVAVSITIWDFLRKTGWRISVVSRK